MDCTAHQGRVPQSTMVKVWDSLRVDFFSTIFEVIDMRSFSNLWYWIALAVLWSTASHFVLGVPYDLTVKARQNGGQQMADLEELVRLNIARLIDNVEVAGLVLTAFWGAGLAMLLITGFFFGVEFSQAVFLMAGPITLVFVLTLSRAHRIRAIDAKGEALCAELRRHRLYVQIIGMISVFVTSIWGMYQNMATGPLGG